jgi:Tol biopolymer transport system component
VSKRILIMLAAGLFFGVTAGYAQEAVIAPGENLVVDGVPKIPASLAETAGRYGSYRFALVSDWHPTRREMLIRTRFGDTPQVHLVKMPGGERQQLTFYPDSIANAEFHPNGADYFIFVKDIGGGEWFQFYRYDMNTGMVTLLTDGKARNLLGSWSSGGDQIAYVSTRRTGQDTDLWDESGGSQERSSANPAERWRLGPRRLVS